MSSKSGMLPVLQICHDCSCMSRQVAVDIDEQIKGQWAAAAAVCAADLSSWLQHNMEQQAKVSHAVSLRKMRRFSSVSPALLC